MEQKRPDGQVAGLNRATPQTSFLRTWPHSLHTGGQPINSNVSIYKLDINVYSSTISIANPAEMSPIKHCNGGYKIKN